mgnify:FL=1
MDQRQHEVQRLVMKRIQGYEFVTDRYIRIPIDEETLARRILTFYQHHTFKKSIDSPGYLALQKHMLSFQEQ